MIARTAFAIAFVIAATLTLFPFLRRSFAGSSLERLGTVEPMRSALELSSPPVPALMGDVCILPSPRTAIPTPAATGPSSGESPEPPAGVGAELTGVER